MSAVCAHNAWFPRAMSNYVPCDGVLLFSSKQCVISLTFCNTRNNLGPGKCYKPQPSAWLATPRPLIIPDITKSHSIGVQYRHWWTWPCLEIWLKFTVVRASRLTRCVLKLDFAHARRGKSIHVYNPTIHCLCVFGIKEDWRLERRLRCAGINK